MIEDHTVTAFNQQSKIINQQLFLARRAVMAAASGDHDSLDERLADKTGFGFAAVNTMLELEVPFLAVGIHIVGNGRAAEGDRFFEHLFHSQVEFAELFARNARSAATRADAGAEQRFIGVNVSYAAQKFLVEQGALDGGLAAAKQFQEGVKFDFQRLDPRGAEVARLRNTETAEAARIDEAQFPARG